MCERVSMFDSRRIYTPKVDTVGTPTVCPEYGGICNSGASGILLVHMPPLLRLYTAQCYYNALSLNPPEVAHDLAKLPPFWCGAR